MKNNMWNAVGLMALAALACSPAFAQEKGSAYPNRPIRLIITVSPGAGADAIARSAAQIMTEKLGQQAVVDNRPGAGGAIAAELVARAAPDGYTLLSTGETLLIQGVTKRLPFDVLRTFDPVVATSAQPYILLATLNLPAKSVKELAAHSATQALTYAGGAGPGSTVHLGMERFAKLTGTKLLFVPYKGSAPSIIAIMGGEIHLAATSSIAATTAIRTGKVRALANLGLTRIPAMPDLPTVAEQGYPGFKVVNRYNLFAPAGTPRSILATLNRLVSDGMHAPQMAKRLEVDGSQPAERMTPEQLKSAMAREHAEIEQQIRELKLELK